MNTSLTRSVLILTTLLLALACSNKPAQHPEPASSASATNNNEELPEPPPPDPSSDPEPWTQERIDKCPVVYRNHCFPSAEQACAFINCPEERCEFLYSFPNQVACRDPEDDVPAAAEE